MEIKNDEKVKASALLLSIVLTLVLLLTRMAARNKEQQNNLPATRPTALAAAVLPPRNEQGNPFWTPYALQSQKQADTAAHPPAVTPAPDKGGPAGSAVVIRIQTPDLCLMGIVTDGTRIAVIKVGEDMRYLQTGAAVDPSTRIESIAAGRVTLNENGKLRELSLGQQLVRAAGKALPQAAELSHEPVPPALPGFAEPGQLRAASKINAGF
jgi:hypothetical protein